MKHSLPCLAALALISGSAGAQNLTIFLGAPGAPGDVRVANDNGLLPSGQPLALTDITLLPIEFTLHSPLDAWDASMPQTIPLPGGASGIRLPSGAALYAYRRDSVAGATFGFFQVTSSGDAVVLLERAATGPGLDESPFTSRLAIAPGGASVLIATTVPAGGDLLELDLMSGAAVDRTAGSAPIDFATPGGLALTTNQGFAATGAELLRFARQPGALAAPLTLATPGGSATWVPGDFARSADGAHLALIAGSTPTDEYVFAIGPSGTPVRVTDAPATISPAGFAPDVQHGPFFAISTDGSHVGWRTETALSTEGWLRETGLGAPAAQELTGDALFLDTLDEIAPFAFFSPARLTMGVGEVGDPLLGGIDTMDLFGVTLDIAGQPVFENTTLTSGLAAPPFFAKPGIAPTVIRHVPGTTKLLVQDGNLHRLTLSGPGAAPLVIEGTSKSLRFDAAAGGFALLGIERDKPFKDMRFVRLDLAAATWTDLAILPKDTSIDRSIARGDGWMGVILSLGGNQLTLGADLATGGIELTLPVPFAAGPTLDLDSNGDLLLSTGPVGVNSLFARDSMPGTPSLIGLPAVGGFLLPR